MLADPQSITIASSAVPCARVLTGTSLGKFEGANTTLEVESDVQKNGRRRHVARLRQQKVTTDPLVSTTNVQVSDTIALTINRPALGYSDTEVLEQVTGFIAWLTDDTDANLKKILAGEN